MNSFKLQDFEKSIKLLSYRENNLHACQIYQVLLKLDQEYQASLLLPSILCPTRKILSKLKNAGKYSLITQVCPYVTSFCSKPSISTSSWCNVFFVWPSHCFRVDPTASISSMKMMQGAYEIRKYKK